MIPYTERDSDLNFRPPYRITGVEALSAVRGIDREKAQEWVHQAWVAQECSVPEVSDE
jgi:hypothetical protein